MSLMSTGVISLILPRYSLFEMHIFRGSDLTLFYLLFAIILVLLIFSSKILNFSANPNMMFSLINAFCQTRAGKSHGEVNCPSAASKIVQSVQTSSEFCSMFSGSVNLKLNFIDSFRLKTFPVTVTVESSLL